MQPYFYIIKHKETGKYYAGSRTAKNSNPNELLKEDGYHTSSTIVNTIIKTMGLHSFEVVKIKIFNTPNEAYDYETRFLKKVNASSNKNFLNLHNNVFTLGKMIDDEFVSFASMGGKVAGNICAMNGHLDRIREMVDEEKRKENALKAMYEKQAGWFSLTDDERRKYASLGGKVQGKHNAESGHMLRIREMVDEEKRIANVKKSLSENKTGCFLDKDLHRKSASLGGKTQGKKNAEGDHLKNISRQYWKDVRNGKIDRKKRKWYNNGYEERQIPEDDPIPESFVVGRLKK